MAMTQCKECGKDISDQAAACPYCGFPSETERWRKNLQNENAKYKIRMNALKAGVGFGIFVFFPCWLMVGFINAFFIGIFTFAVVSFFSLGLMQYRIRHKDLKKNDSLWQ